MKTLLVGINSKFIHSCLAIRYLKANTLAVAEQIELREFTINETKDYILTEIYKEKPDTLALSCYIWNIEAVLSIITEIKKLLPSCIIILGGPEVSYDAKELMQANASIDYIICGEGEIAFSALISSLQNKDTNYKSMTGLAYRENNSVVFNIGFNLIPNLDDIISPYSAEMMDSLANRIVYFEASRGCPFSCAYCISSTFNGIRFFSLDRVKQDLNKILEYKPRLVKFVDRTFNCNKKRTKEILNYIINLDCETTFHFEAAADLFDDEMLDILGRARAGAIQLEIGIQTVNEKTLEEIDRVTNLDVLWKNVKRILEMGSIHVHLDLIAGLPYENLESFIQSFNAVYQLQPHQLQMGFLKLLKGSKVRNEALKHGFVYRTYPPYEVLYNDYISLDDIILLKDVEEVLERYFNSGRFSGTLSQSISILHKSPFEFYYSLACYCREKGCLDRPLSYRENIAVLFDFMKQSFTDSNTLNDIRQLMLLDFLSCDSSCTIPECLKNEANLLGSESIHRLLQDESFIGKYLPDFKGMQARNILKRVYFAVINNGNDCSGDIVLFDYTHRDPVSGMYRSIAIEPI